MTMFMSGFQMTFHTASGTPSGALTGSTRAVRKAKSTVSLRSRTFSSISSKYLT